MAPSNSLPRGRRVGEMQHAGVTRIEPKAPEKPVEALSPSPPVPVVKVGEIVPIAIPRGPLMSKVEVVGGVVLAIAIIYCIVTYIKI